VGPRTGLDHLEKRKFLTIEGLELQPSVLQPAADRAIPASREDIEDFMCAVVQ
jgi:hypothetical protein